VSRSICIELFSDVKNLGRFLLRDRDTTIVAGIVTRIIT
jgi:translation elongation factor EF-1alpha